MTFFRSASSLDLIFLAAKDPAPTFRELKTVADTDTFQHLLDYVSLEVEINCILNFELNSLLRGFQGK